MRRNRRRENVWIWRTCGARGATDFRSFLASPSCGIDICGTGGAGKSTLAFQIAQWGFADDREQRLADHKMLPILIEDDFQNVGAVVKSTVFAWFGEELDIAFIKALLRLKRVLIIVDGLSERDEATMRYVSKIHGAEPVNALICTSRHETAFLISSSVRVYPLPLTEDSVLHFATGLIRARDGTGLLGIERQVEFASHLARVITRQGSSGSITPLLITLAVSRAAELAEQGRGLGELPTSVPELYFDYLRRLNRSGDRETDLSEAAERLGRLALGATFIPGDFSGRKAREALRSDPHHPEGQEVYIARLLGNGVLMRRASGTDEMFRFTLDPVAEMLAAVSWARECSSDGERWREFAARLNGFEHSASGFYTAMRVVHETYWREQSWPSPQQVWPEEPAPGSPNEACIRGS